MAISTFEFVHSPTIPMHSRNISSKLKINNENQYYMALFVYDDVSINTIETGNNYYNFHAIINHCQQRWDTSSLLYSIVISKKCFPGSAYMVLSLARSNIQPHNNVVTVRGEWVSCLAQWFYQNWSNNDDCSGLPPWGLLLHILFSNV